MHFDKKEIEFSLDNINVIKEKNGSLQLSFKIFPKEEKNRTKLLKLLTKREIEILKLVIKGKNNSEIAKELILSINTVKAHLSKIFQKMDVKDRLQAVVKAIQENIIEM